MGSAGNAVSAVGAESMGGAAGSAGAAAGGAAAGSAGSAAGDERPLDVLVLFDVSGSTCLNLAGDVNELCPPQAESMRLELMTSALSAWLDASESGGIGVGLTLFGADPIGRAVCDPAHYQTPLVAIAPLPGKYARNLQQARRAKSKAWLRHPRRGRGYGVRPRGP